MELNGDQVVLYYTSTEPENQACLPASVLWGDPMHKCRIIGLAICQSSGFRTHDAVQQS